MSQLIQYTIYMKNTDCEIMIDFTKHDTKISQQ